MPVNLYHSRDGSVRIALLKAVVSPDDLATAIALPKGPAQPSRCLVSFASAGLFAVTHEGMAEALGRTKSCAMPEDIVLFAPSELSFGVARMLKSGTKLRNMAGVRLEREEKHALARAGLDVASLKRAVFEGRALRAASSKKPAPHVAGRA